MRMSPHHMMPGDPDAIKDVHIADGTAKRVWAFARPYRGTIIVFLIAIFAAALLALVPPFVVREIIDQVQPAQVEAEPASTGAVAGAGAPGAGNPLPTQAEPTQPVPPKRPAHYLWAVLIARIYEVFPLVCPICGG